MADDEYDIDLTGTQLEVDGVPMHTFGTTPTLSDMTRVVLAQDDLVVDFSNTTTEIYPDVPVWAENEPGTLREMYSVGSLEKALVLIQRDKLEEFAPSFWKVLGSEVYTVQVIENPYGGIPWTTCTCPNGQNRASRPLCYHSAAVLMKVTQVNDQAGLAGDTEAASDQGEDEDGTG